jgi:hypothetical protein
MAGSRPLLLGVLFYMEGESARAISGGIGDNPYASGSLQADQLQEAGWVVPNRGEKLLPQ